MRPSFRPAVRAAGAGLVVAALAACAPPPGLSANDERLQVITTTGLLKDLVENVGGERVNVASIVPNGADPHAYEPTLRKSRDVVYAEVAFSNYMLLEEHSIIKTLDANLRDGAPSISLAEDAVKYAAEIIPLVENVQLDTIWLGLRVRGDGTQYGADRSSDVLIKATAVAGPGDLFGYLTGTFGSTELYFDSSDGFEPGDGYRDDTATLPADAHTHMSWAFTAPGTYRLRLEAQLNVGDRRPVTMGAGTFTFAVGINPESVAPEATVLDAGHADLTVDLDSRTIVALHDPEGGGEHAQRTLRADDIVVEVPNKAIDEVPAGREYRFLGRAGSRVFQLPQAVLGKHIHGEIDPHLWQNVRNVMAYVELIRDTLITQDPAGAQTYRDNTARYLARLDALDRYVRQQIEAIPAPRRYLITTHDAFAYLAKAYGLRIGGFVTPNPAVEPSLENRRKLTDTIQNLDVPAVFLEPNLASRSSTLSELATDNGVAVCPIYGDALDETVRTYEQLVRFNADSLRTCLTKEPSA